MDVSKSKVSRFWVSSFPLFNATLFIYPTSSNQDNNSHNVTIYSPTGKLINQATITCKDNYVAVVELDPFLGDCELNFGLKHCQLEVNSPPLYDHTCRLNSETDAAIVSEVTMLKSNVASFFPLKFSSRNLSVLVLSNFSSTDAECQFEITANEANLTLSYNVKSRCTRLLPIEVEFADFLEQQNAKLAYLKAYSESKNIGVQIFERFKINASKEIYSTVNGAYERS